MADAPLTLTCQCCAFTQQFTNSEEAFQAGWDEPTHLPHWPVCCNLCPGVAAMGLIDHSAAHERWAKTGRPAEFSREGLPPMGREAAALTEALKAVAKHMRARDN